MNPIKPNEDATIARPWYRQFWAWFVLSPLILVVLVSLVTVTIAVRYADDRVVDNYYKEGRMINIRLDEDLQAQALGISANVRFDFVTNEAVLILAQQPSTQHQSAQNSLPADLLLEMSHAVSSDLDTTLPFSRVAKHHYRADLSRSPLLLLEARQRWYLRLKPVYTAVNTDSHLPWRLRGEIHFSSHQSVVLTPPAL